MRVRIPDRPWDDTVGDQRYDTGQVTMRVPINFQLKTPGTIPMNVHNFASGQKDYPGSLTIVQLNKTYATVIAKAEKDRVSLVREAQGAWIKRRDEGVKLYISLFPQAERERRRLQFLGDISAGRIDTPFDYWELM